MCSRTSAVVAIGVAVLAAACGSSRKPQPSTQLATGSAPATTAERILGLLPMGAQIIVELDLARLRANPVVGGAVVGALAGGGSVGGVSASPLAHAELVVLAAYGVGTAEAATVTVLAANEPIADATAIAEGLYAVGPEAWVEQLTTRAAITAEAPVGAPPELLALRDRAMPPNAPGAAIRLTAQLSFDARIALARQVGLENAPGQVSVWGDVVDDLAIIIDADAADPGEPANKQAVARLEATMHGALGALASLPEVRALGLPASLTGAKLAVRGTWVRTIIAIGPAHLRRVVERAQQLMQLAKPPPPPAPEHAS